MIEWMYRDDDHIKVHRIDGNEYAGVYEFMNENDFTTEDLYIVGLYLHKFINVRKIK